LTWAKVVGLFCLLGWIGSRLVAASTRSFEPGPRRSGVLSTLNLAALLALVGGLLSVALQVVVDTRRLKLPSVGGLTIAGIMALVVLVWRIYGLAKEVVHLRFRRLDAIGWQCWVESIRRMGAPWALIVVFVVILAFFDWFSQPSIPEMGRSYVSSLTFLISIL